MAEEQASMKCWNRKVRMMCLAIVSTHAVEMDQSHPPIANCLLSIDDTQIEELSFGSHGHPEAFYR
jgi:hypothetical protein